MGGWLVTMLGIVFSVQHTFPNMEIFYCDKFTCMQKLFTPPTYSLALHKFCKLHFRNPSLPCLSTWSHLAPLAQPGGALKYYISLYAYFFKIQMQFLKKIYQTKPCQHPFYLHLTAFLFVSVKTNQAPSLPFSSLHVHVLSNWKDTSCLHWEYWGEIWLSVELHFHVLVFSCLQGHCFLTPTPKGCIPGCVHLKYVVIPGWSSMMLVWAPRVCVTGCYPIQ